MDDIASSDEPELFSSSPPPWPDSPADFETDPDTDRDIDLGTDHDTGLGTDLGSDLDSDLDTDHDIDVEDLPSQSSPGSQPSPGLVELETEDEDDRYDVFGNAVDEGEEAGEVEVVDVDVDVEDEIDDEEVEDNQEEQNEDEEDEVDEEEDSQEDEDEDEDEDEEEDSQEDEDEDEDEDEEDSQEDEDEDEDLDGELDEDMDFDLDMRDDVDLDLADPYLSEDEGLFVDDYMEDLGEERFDALHQAFLHHLEHHLAAREPWGLRDHLPMADNPHGGGARDAAARARYQRDQLVQIEMAGQRNNAADDRRRMGPPPDVIDLTGDDDVEMPVRRGLFGQPLPPVQPARSIPQRPENIRRRNFQGQNGPPRLNRSDGSYVNDQQVIVLSSSDDDLPMGASPRRNNGNHINNIHQNNPHLPRANNRDNADRGARNARFGNQHRPGPAAPAQNPNNHRHHNPHGNGGLRHFNQLNLPLFQFLSNHPPALFPQPMMAGRGPNVDDDIVITGARNVGNDGGFEPVAPGRQVFGIGPIHLDYAANGQFQPAPGPPEARGPPKPPHIPPKPARPGFTRDTGPDVVAICPSCDEELAYDPDEEDAAAASSSKKSRSKKSTAEHHFWAVKDCGHVYCRRCFENRRSTSKGTGFRHDPEGSKKVFCAVEDCDSEIGAKSAWVGIFC